MKYRITGKVLNAVIDADSLEALSELQPGDKVQVKAGAKCEYPSKWNASQTKLDDVKLVEPGQSSPIPGVVTTVGEVNAIVNLPWTGDDYIYSISDLEEA